MDSLPHADTLFRLLSKIDVGQIEHAHIDLVERLIRKKKFANYRINNCYPIAIDGTQKVGGATLWSESLQEKRLSGSDQDAPEHRPLSVPRLCPGSEPVLSQRHGDSADERVLTISTVTPSRTSRTASCGPFTAWPSASKGLPPGGDAAA
ncbi:MAG: hypothetical protein IPI02_20040 [Sterolibacteriaceae bacterium]|nr:hypothetical protein [Sterolibacteriaceae bacterium]